MNKLSTMPSTRKTVRDTDIQRLGMYVVMRHSTKLTRAHFGALHDTYDTASAEAIRLVAEQAQFQPELQHHYYVLRVDGVFSAGVDGWHSEEVKS